MIGARERFNEGEWMRGLENVAHATYVDDRPDEPTRLRLVRDVLGATWSPEDAA